MKQLENYRIPYQISSLITFQCMVMTFQRLVRTRLFRIFLYLWSQASVHVMAQLSVLAIHAIRVNI